VYASQQSRGFQSCKTHLSNVAVRIEDLIDAFVRFVRLAGIHIFESSNYVTVPAESCDMSGAFLERDRPGRERP